MITVGLTGGLGTGKTSVLTYFKKLGAHVLSLDDVVHQELKTNRNLKRKIKESFGQEIFSKGQINRALFAQKVFVKRQHLKKLNALIHPLVKKRMFEFLDRQRHKQRKAIIVVEVPLLFETGFDRFFDTTVVVALTPEIQKKRFLHHAVFENKDIIRRMRWQLPIEKKIALCDFVIDNNGTRSQTLRQVKNLMKLLRAL